MHGDCGEQSPCHHRNRAHKHFDNERVTHNIPTAINYWVSATDIDNNLDSIYTMVRPSGGNANSFNIDWTTADYPSCDQQSGFAKTGSQTSSFSLPIRLNSKAWPIMGYYWFGPIALDVPDWNSGDTWTGSPSLTVLVSTHNPLASLQYQTRQ